MKKVLSVLLVLLLSLSLSGCNASAIMSLDRIENKSEGEYSGKTVILHSNDVHGAIEGYAYMAGAKNYYESKGATVLTVDAGDYLDGSVYVSNSRGVSAIELMNMVGYDACTLGNHDFEYGVDGLYDAVKDLTAAVLASNVRKGNDFLYNSEIIFNIGKLKVGFFGLATPETMTKINPNYTKGVSFSMDEELYKDAQREIDLLKGNCDVLICLSHLGVYDESVPNRSIDMYENTSGIDFVIDGHSHTVMESYNDEYPIQSTGTAFENIGVIVIDNKSKKIEDSFIKPTNDFEPVDDVLAYANKIIDDVDSIYNEEFAHLSFDMDGSKQSVRSGENALAELVADSMKWFVLNDNENNLPEDKVVAIVNGGSVRTDLLQGNISRKDIVSVCPFDDDVDVVYVSGKDLLEALEASTFCTPSLIGGFPQVSGINFTIDTSKAYDPCDEEYPNSTYFGPKTINRVTINDINGKEFKEDEEYIVITSSFCSAGGDTYYALARSGRKEGSFDTGAIAHETIITYIKDGLNGEIPDIYKEPQGRITIK